MTTNHPVPSNDPTDLLFNAQKLDQVVNGSDQYYTDRLGVNRRTMEGISAAADVVLGGLGYAPPVAYASGISLTLATQTVEHAGEVYAPKVADLPFTTSGAFETEKFRLIQGIASSELASSYGSLLVGHLPNGSGAVATTVQSKLRETISARDFGALGDSLGTLASADFIANANSYYATTGELYLQEPRFKAGFDTQDFVALQLAMDAASATGKELLIPAGDYIITKCLIVKRSGLSICGEGMFTTKIRQSSLFGWLAEASDDSQMLIGGKVYASYNYGTGKKWSTTGVLQADNFQMEGVGVIGDKSGFAAGGWYMAGGGASLPALQSTQLYQSGVQPQGELARFSKNITINGCYFTGHAECGIEPTYVDGLKIEGNYATQNGWQFIGTDHAIRNAQIINNVGMEPAVGNSESAFLDLEEGQGADFENITVSGNIHYATVSGFVKVHPRETSGMATGTNIRNLVISDNISVSGGATSLGFYGQYWTGADTALTYGNVENVTITGNVIKGYKGNIFRIGASDAGSGKAKGVVVANNYIESDAAAANNTSAFDIPKLVEGCEIVNNIIRLKGTQQYLSRISWQSATDPTRTCRNIRIAGNDVELKSSSFMIDFAQVDGLTIEGNRIDASGTTLAAGGGFIGAQPGGTKSNIYVRNNKITLYQRNFILAYYQRLKNFVVENNHIIATTPDSATRYLFAINQQTSQCFIRNNRIEAGIAPVFMLGDGVGTNAANKCDNFVFTGNEVTHDCATNAFEVRQCMNFEFSDNRVNATAGGSGLVAPVYTTASMFLLEGAVVVQGNTFRGLGSGSYRIGIRLSFKQGAAQDSVLVAGNLVQAAAGSYLSYPIAVEGNPRTVGIFSNIFHGVENAVSRYGITVTGSTATPKIEACIAGNLIHGGASTLAVDAATNVNVTNTGNHLSTSY